jgi:hypothetical protein
VVAVIDSLDRSPIVVNDRQTLLSTQRLAEQGAPKTARVGGPIVKQYLVAAVSAASILLAPCVAAAEVFNFSFTSEGGDFGAGQLFTGDVASPFAVTGITGSVNGTGITGLSPYAAADQLLFTGGGANFGVGGLSFSSSVGVLYNFTSYPDGTNHITRSDYDPEGDGFPTPFKMDFSVSSATVPEPATWGLMVLGFAGMGALIRRRREAAEHSA